MLTYLNDQLLVKRETNINERAKYTANTGMVLLNTANTNTDGTGTLGTIITGAANGTYICSLTVKGSVTTQRGMVRIFLYNGTVTALIDEIDIPAVTQSSKTEAFEVTYELGIYLKNGYVLKASTVTGNSFIIIADGLDYAYP